MGRSSKTFIYIKVISVTGVQKSQNSFGYFNYVQDTAPQNFFKICFSHLLPESGLSPCIENADFYIYVHGKWIGGCGRAWAVAYDCSYGPFKAGWISIVWQHDLIVIGEYEVVYSSSWIVTLIKLYVNYSFISCFPWARIALHNDERL